jgi:7-cyano-7-deazaguanine synthase
MSRGGPRAEAAEDCVLLSGGVDSACALAELRLARSTPRALFVDYGQAAAKEEKACSQALAQASGTQWLEVAVTAPASLEGELMGRNALLVHTALFVLRPQTPLVIHLGIHAGTGYRDCSPAFLNLMQDSLDFHADGRVQLVAPFLNWSKAEVVQRAREIGVDLSRSYSCERGGRALR